MFISQYILIHSQILLKKNKVGFWLIWLILVAQMVKNLPTMQETWVWSLGWEDPLEEDMATHSSILAWRIPMDRGPGDYSPWVAESDPTERLSTITAHWHTVNFYLKKNLASDWSRSQVALPPIPLITFFNHLFAESGDTKVVSRII